MIHRQSQNILELNRLFVIRLFVVIQEEVPLNGKHAELFPLIPVELIAESSGSYVETAGAHFTTRGNQMVKQFRSYGSIANAKAKRLCSSIRTPPARIAAPHPRCSPIALRPLC